MGVASRVTTMMRAARVIRVRVVARMGCVLMMMRGPKRTRIAARLKGPEKSRAPEAAVPRAFAPSFRCGDGRRIQRPPAITSRLYLDARDQLSVHEIAAAVNTVVNVSVLQQKSVPGVFRLGGCMTCLVVSRGPIRAVVVVRKLCEARQTQ